MYDNVPGMEMRIGERVRWYLAGIQLSEKHLATTQPLIWFPPLMLVLFGFPPFLFPFLVSLRREV